MDISIGFDPGIDTGGIAVLSRDNYSDLQTCMTPREPSQTIHGKKVLGSIDLPAMFQIIMEAARKIYIDGGGTLLLIYEDVHNIKGSSSGSNFSFGERKGEIRGLVYAAKEAVCRIYSSVNVVVDKVYSKKWQQHSIDFTDKKLKTTGKSDTKFNSIAAAQRLFPGHSFTKPRGKVPQDGMTDAALIALYGVEVVIPKL